MVVPGFLIKVVFLVEHRLRSMGSAVVAHMLNRSAAWGLPRPGIELMSRALGGRFSTTIPPGKSQYLYILKGGWSLWAAEALQNASSFISDPEDKQVTQYQYRIFCLVIWMKPGWHVEILMRCKNLSDGAFVTVYNKLLSTVDTQTQGEPWG